jgi:hypothetical protein
MQVTVVVPEEIVREAATRSLPVIDFVESLIDAGLRSLRERPTVDDAIERIRAIRTVNRPSSSR